MFEILGSISEIEVIAVEGAIRDLARIRRFHGPGRWRKLKGVARVRLADGGIQSAEVHWYEAHGIGRREYKIKCLLD